LTDILKSILAINPKAQVSINAEDVKQITWHNGTKPISEKEILTKQKELIAEYNSKEYQRKRRFEYPPIEDQLDDLYHNGIDGWKSTIKAIKDKYPKG
tara:strand:+ start:484 stop:777 length:294 start_codon:yes stop_codon:yes gene_type:complete